MSGHPVRVPAAFAGRVWQARTSRGWSMKQAAAEAGVSTSAVWGAENGRDVYLSSAVALAGALGLSLDGLAGVSGDGKDSSDEGTRDDY